MSWLESIRRERPASGLKLSASLEVNGDLVRIGMPIREKCDTREFEIQDNG